MVQFDLEIRIRIIAKAFRIERVGTRGVRRYRCVTAAVRAFHLGEHRSDALVLIIIRGEEQGGIFADIPEQVAAHAYIIQVVAVGNRTVVPVTVPFVIGERDTRAETV